MIVAVDSGGTFCDCVVLDGRGALTRAKAPSTPPDVEVGVIDAVAEAARRLGLSLDALLADTVLFAHGTTVATNALLTRTGARVALLTTKGHEDAILIGRTAQKVAGLSESEIIDVSRLTKAEPLVPRPRIHGIEERVDSRGRVVAPLSLERCAPLLARLREQGVEAVAVCLLWSFLHPAHERALRDWLRAALPDCFVTISSELAPVIREYERTSTTVLNAYLTPLVARYLDRMRARLEEARFNGALVVMLSAGGVASVAEAGTRGVALLSSGPAGGVLGAQSLSERLGFSRVITTDVGGTSFDVGVIVDGEPGYSEMPVVDKYPIALPVVDVASIGAGGGSIAWVEPETGVLRVGPQSAGARPGPACYETGGAEPTVTDANLLLGRLNPEYFLGGRLRLHPDKAREAIRARVADPLGMTPEAAAAAIVEIVDAHMADLIRKVTVERGQDPAGFVVFAYGGAGGLHAGAYAAALGCREVVVPSMASVFSAFGIAASDVKRVEQLSDPMRAPFDLARWRAHFAALEASLTTGLERERLPTGALALARFAHLQFRGQVHTVRVPVHDMGSPDMAPQTPRRSSRPGVAGALLDSQLPVHDMGGPDMAPQPPRRSSRPGVAGALLDSRLTSESNEPTSNPDTSDRIVNRFVELYEARFGAGTAYLEAGVEAVAFSVEAIARLPKPALEARPAGDGDAAAAIKHRRAVYFHELGRFEPVPVLAGERLRAGHRIGGPALVEAEDMTVLVHPGHTLEVDGTGNLRLHLS